VYTSLIRLLQHQVGASLVNPAVVDELGGLNFSCCAVFRESGAPDLCGEWAMIPEKRSITDVGARGRQ